MDGWAFLAVYNRQTQQQVPIIVMSGYESDARKLPDVAGFLYKPFDTQSFVELVAQHTPSH